MPTDTFYRLPETKRVRLINAIYKELARVPASEMSINRIIREADIPRGSFYQYFTNKDDMISFLFEEFTKSVKIFMDIEAPSCDGDPFMMLKKMLLEIQSIGEREETKAFVRNLMVELKARSEIVPTICRGSICETVAVEWFDRYFERSSLCNASEKDFPLILDLLLSLLKTSIAELYLERIEKDEVIRRFDAKVCFIKHGLLPEKVR